MKISILLLLLTFSSTTLAKTVARVLEVNGNSFVFFGKNQSKQLRYADKIEDMSEVMVEDGGTVTLKDELGRVYHLAGGTYAKLFQDSVEVKSGNVWVTSTSNKFAGIISSVNGIAKFSRGHFIYSFDNILGKSQVLVLTGQVEFSNVVESNLSINVPAGHFSFVDQNKANGLPRGATRVGLASYKQVKSLFHGIDNLKTTNFDKALFGQSLSPKRGIASVPTDSSPRKGKLIFLESNGSRSIASVSKKESAYDYYKSIKKKVGSSKAKRSGSQAKVRFFGFDDSVSVKKPKKVKKTTSVKRLKVMQKPVVKVVREAKKPIKVESKRKPASVERAQLIQQINAKGAFEDSLNQANRENKRHPEEVNALIDELKSYDQTYQEDY